MIIDLSATSSGNKHRDKVCLKIEDKFDFG